ncbi:MAG TPA: bifunctional DNA primase/polymerase, partial [Pseudomonadales bacterium]|nr:bifunctional DNA primase/polymerase [Pseudomonadales bacterium]
MTTVLDTAKFYISKGWDVFPCRPKDKTPAVKWAEEATRDAAKIAEWFTGSDYNIGIATGARSGIVVLDIDAGHDGEKTLAELVRANGEMPSTPIALTGGG